MSKNLKSWLFLILLALIWGSSYLLIKRGLEGFAPLQLAALRVSITTVALVPFGLYHWRKIDWKKWKPYAVVGLSGNAFPAFLFALAQTKLSSSLAGLLSSLTPLFTLIIGIAFFGFQATRARMGGVLLGLTGAITLITFGQDSAIHIETGILFGLLAIVATICYAISSNVIKAFLQEQGSMVILVAAFVFIGIPSLIYLFTTDFFERLAASPQAWSALGYIALLSLGGTLFASFIFIRLVQLRDAVFASVVSYLIPLIALGWGLFDGEPVTPFHFLGMALILSGVYLTRK